MKVLFTYDYGQEKMEAVKALGYEVIYAPEKSIELSEQNRQADILVCYNPFEKIDICEMPYLKWIQLSSIGIDQLPKEKCLRAGITITNNRGGYSKPMGEWVVLNLLEIFKKRKTMYMRQEKKQWFVDTQIEELVGKRVGFLGTGSISQEAAKRLSGFEMTCVGFNTSGHEAPYFDQCYPLREFYKFAKEIDVVVLLLPATEKTFHMVNEEFLSLLRDDAVFINLSRGSNVDEKALVHALEKGKFRGVALDVFETEPLCEKSPLWGMERVYLSAHNSWISQKRNERRYETIYKNLRRFSEGKPLENRVNLLRGY